MVRKPPNSIQELLAEGKLLCYVAATSKNRKQTQKQLKKIQNTCTDSSVRRTLDLLRDAGAQLDETTFAALLRWCGFTNSLADGKSVHYHIVKSGLSQNRFLRNHLIQMYGNCGELNKAYSIFDRTRNRDVFSWNFLIKACVKHGHDMFALELYEQMQQEGTLPDNILLVNLLPACDAIAKSNKLYAVLVGSGHEADVSFVTTLLKVYGKFGHIESARRVFDNMIDKDAVSWTAMISVYAQHKLTKDALLLFANMSESGLHPDDVTFLSVLSACTSHGYLYEGMVLHAFIISSGLEAMNSLDSALLHLYGKCGALADLQHMFGKMHEHEVASWTAIIAGYAQHSLVKESMQAFDQMHQEGLMATKTTLMSTVCACDKPTWIKAGMRLHANIVCSGCNSEVTLYNALISMYGNCGNTQQALNVLEDMLEKDVVSWNALIQVFIQHKKDKEALKFYKQMLNEGTFPDTITFVRVLDMFYTPSALKEGKQMHACVLGAGLVSSLMVGTALVNMYAKCGNMNNAATLFQDVSERDTVAWNAFIEAHLQNKLGREGLQMYEQMQQEGILPEKSTYISVLSACANHGVLAECKWTHARILGSRCDLDLVLGNTLLNTYAKCGSVHEAWIMFEELSVRDIFSWNTMIAAFAQNGQGKLAIQLLPSMEMDRIPPDGVTFLSLLSACSHAGLIDEASGYLVSMENDYGLEPDVGHYNCMVDLYGRAGRLDEAEDWLHKMSVEPTSVSWLILLNACKHYVDVKRGERAAECVFRLDPMDVTPYILLSNTYASAGREDDAAAVLRRMLDKGLKLQPGHPLLKTIEDKPSGYRDHSFFVALGG